MDVGARAQCAGYYWRHVHAAELGRILRVVFAGVNARLRRGREVTESFWSARVFCGYTAGSARQDSYFRRSSGGNIPLEGAIRADSQNPPCCEYSAACIPRAQRHCSACCRSRSPGHHRQRNRGPQHAKLHARRHRLSGERQRNDRWHAGGGNVGDADHNYRDAAIGPGDGTGFIRGRVAARISSPQRSGCG